MGTLLRELFLFPEGKRVTWGFVRNGVLMKLI